MDNPVVITIAVALGVAAAALITYAVGYAFSLGYHRAKREFIARMVRDCTKEENRG